MLAVGLVGDGKTPQVLPQVQLTGIDFIASAVEFTQQRNLALLNRRRWQIYPSLTNVLI
jgi:hypothetical protein